MSTDNESEIVELDGKQYVVTKTADGEDVAVPVDDTYALAQIKRAEADMVHQREKTSRNLEKQKTTRLSEITITMVVLAVIATCAFG